MGARVAVVALVVVFFLSVGFCLDARVESRILSSLM